MNELQIFKNEEFGEVRTVTIDNEPCGIILIPGTFPNVNSPLQSKNLKKILCGMTRC